MRTWIDMQSWLLFAIGYVIIVISNEIIRRVDFKRCPEKGERYRALPLIYKLACWFVVMPLLGAILIHMFFGFLGLVGFLMLEVACVRWYRKAGLLH